MRVPFTDFGVDDPFDSALLDSLLLHFCTHHTLLACAIAMAQFAVLLLCYFDALILAYLEIYER